MGNGVTTDSIKSSKYDAKVSKLEAKEKAKQEKIRKENEKNKAAADLVNSLSGHSDENKARKIRSDIKDNLEQMYKDGQITKEQYKEAKSYANSKEYKEKLEAELDSSSRILVTGIAGKAEGSSIGKVKDDVKDTLKEKFEAGEITEAEYKNAKKYAKTGTWIGRFFGKKEKESREIFQTREYQNNLVKTKEEGPKFDAKLQAKMNLAGIKTDDVYEIGKKNGGGEILEDGRVNGDATINYSFKKKQPGEMDAVETAFNNNEAGVKFTKKETNKIMKQAGYHVEKKIRWGKAIETGIKTAVPVAPLGLVTITSTSTSAASGAAMGAEAASSGFAKASVAFGAVPAAAGFVIGTAGKAIADARRVEDRAIPTNVPEGVTTYEQYAKYLDDNYSTSRGAALGKDIAKQFIGDNGKLKVEELNKALQTTSGTIASTSTPLNKREAYGLLMSTASKETKTPVKEENLTPVVIQAPQPEECEVKVTQSEIKKTVAVPTDCHTVKAGDNWFAIAKAKYNADDQEAVIIARKLKDAYFEANKVQLAKQGIKSSKGAFFAKVGDELCVPSTVFINGKTFKYDKDAAVQAGTVSENYKGATIKADGNIFKKTVTKPIYVGKTCDGDTVSGESIDSIKEKLEQENPNKHYVIVK